MSGITKIERREQSSMNQTSDFLCTVCQKQKNELKPRRSKLIPSMQMFLCNECFVGKKEPRFAVILVGRKDGWESVQEYIKNHRYVGDEIPASDLI